MSLPSNISKYLINILIYIRAEATEFHECTHKAPNTSGHKHN